MVLDTFHLPKIPKKPKIPKISKEKDLPQGSPLPKEILILGQKHCVSSYRRKNHLYFLSSETLKIKAKS